jgi:hypothetical protein
MYLGEHDLHGLYAAAECTENNSVYGANSVCMTAVHAANKEYENEKESKQ